MPATVNIGTLEGLLRWKADDAELNKSLDEVAKKADVSKKQLNQYNRELASVTSSYQRVVAAIDPVAANTQKYERAERSLVAALKAGIISQEQHNKVLAQAKEKYLSSGASVLTWREEMQRLTTVLGPLGNGINNLISSADGIKAALLGTSSAATATAGSAATATTSLSALYAAALPLVAVLGALALAAGSVFVAFKGFSFLSTAVQEGVQTQLIIERLNNTLESTGSYAGYSSAQLVTLAESYELLSGKSKEQIIAAEIILARFQTLNEKVYPEALRVTLSYSKAMEVTAEAAASKLGPALEGNTRSLGALKEAGIVLSQSQRKTLQDMIEGGKIAEYQATLLAILREKVSGLSDEYDKNLSRQVERANIVLQDFGESIANEVIPAIEDVMNEIVISLGGWDKLKAKVNEVGAAIGNFIRTAIYGLAIAYHELMATFETLVAVITKGASSIVKAHALITGSITSLAAAKELSDISKKSAADAVGHAAAIKRLSEALLDHRVALEGDTEVYQANNTQVEEATKKNAELARSLKELTDIYADNAEQLKHIYDLRMLATTGPLSREDRRAKEAEINQLYKDRLEFLKLEEKFGTAVAKSLMEVKKQLSSLELKAKVELELATKLDPIKIDVNKLFSNIKIDTTILDSAITKEKESQAEIDRIADSIRSYSQEWRDSFKSMRQAANEEIAKVEEAVTEGFMTVAEGERAIAQIRADYYSSQIDQWSGFVSDIGGMLSQLGGEFGKFMSQIVSIAGSVQNVNQTANSLGGWSTAMGAWGGTIAAFVELYKFADSVIQKHKGEKYGTRGGLSVTNGTTVSSFTSQDSLGLTRAIQDVLKAFEDQLRISVSDLEAIEIRVRNNGSAVQAWVKGVWIGTFSDVNTAIREALMVAIKDPSSSLRGMSDIMAEGLSRWTSPDMEGLLSFLTDLRSISDLSLSPLVIDLQKSFVQFNALRESLNKLDQSSEAVIRSQKELTEAQNYLYKQTKAQLLGIDLSAVDALKNLAGFQKGMEDVGNTAKSGLESALQAAENRLKQLERTATGLPTSSGGGQGIAGPQDPGIAIHNVIKYFSDAIEEATPAVSEEISNLKGAIEDYKKQLSEIPKALTDQEMDLGIFSAVEDDLRKLPQYSGLVIEMEKERIKFKYEELRLQLIGMGAWERWEGVWKDLYNAAMAEAGKSPTAGSGRRGGGGGNSDKDNVRDFIKDTKFDISLAGLSEYQKSLKELDRQYDDLIKQAGNDKKLKEQLLNLKEKELDLLKKENVKETRESFREFMGLVTPFDKIRKSAKDLVKEIQGSALGDPEKAAKVGRVMDELNKQLDDLAKETAVGLLGSLLSDMQRFGATEEQMLAARTQMAILEHQLKMANYAKEIAILEAEGRLTDEQMAVIKGAYDFLRGIDPTLILGPPVVPPPANDNINYSAAADSMDDLLSRLKSVQDKIAEWNRIPLSETLQRAHELTDSYGELLSDIEKLGLRSGHLQAQAQLAYQKMVKGFINDTLAEFEDVSEGLEGELSDIAEKFTDINAAFVHLGASQEDLLRAEQARLTAVDRALRQYLDPIKERRESRLIGERSILTGEQQFFEAQKQFRGLLSDIQSGDLTNLTDTVRLADQYEELLRSFTGGEGLRFGLKEIDDALLAIENLVPGFAQEMAEVGTEANPMFTNDSGIIDAMHSNMEAVNTGNTLMLGEMRTSVSEMKIQTQKLDGIEAALYGTINVKNVA